MDQQASVIVVGAGVIGCSVAFQLARMGQRNVVVLEREAMPGAGSTSRANGGIRAQFTTGVERQDVAPLDGDPGRPRGGDRPAPRLPEGGLPLPHRRPGEARRDGAGRRVPARLRRRRRGPRRGGGQAAGAVGRRSERLAGGTFGARDGFIDPGRLCAFFASAAAHDGVSFRYGQEVVAAEEREGGFVLRTADGSSFAAPVVVNAAGAWSARLAAPPRRRRAGGTGSSAPLSDGPGPRPAARDSHDDRRRHGRPREAGRGARPRRLVQRGRAAGVRHHLRPGVRPPLRGRARGAVPVRCRGRDRPAAQLGGPLRGDAGPPRDPRPGRGPARAPPRHRLLGPRRHARPGRGAMRRRDDRPRALGERRRRGPLPRAVRARAS